MDQFSEALARTLEDGHRPGVRGQATAAYGRASEMDSGAAEIEGVNRELQDAGPEVRQFHVYIGGTKAGVAPLCHVAGGSGWSPNRQLVAAGVRELEFAASGEIVRTFDDLASGGGHCRCRCAEVH